jgi:hypothetical protein
MYARKKILSTNESRSEKSGGPGDERYARASAAQRWRQGLPPKGTRQSSVAEPRV